jgi:hypothetical protein
VNDENGDLLADSHNILIRGRNISLLLNVHRVSNVRQIEIRTTEPLLPEPSPFEVEIVILRLKKYKSPGNDRIPVELIEAGNESLYYSEGAGRRFFRSAVNDLPRYTASHLA